MYKNGAHLKDFRSREVKILGSYFLKEITDKALLKRYLNDAFVEVNEEIHDQE